MNEGVKVSQCIHAYVYRSTCSSLNFHNLIYQKTNNYMLLAFPPLLEFSPFLLLVYVGACQMTHDNVIMYVYTT